MKIHYELNKEDYIDFSMHYSTNSKTIKKSLFLQRYILPVGFLIIPFFIEDFRNKDFKFCMGIFLVAAIMWIIFYKKYFNWFIKKRLLKVINEGDVSKNLGEKVMILSEDGIEDIGENDQSKTKWDGIYKIEETDKHIFIYTNSMSAYIVPIRVLEDKQRFLAALYSRYKNITA